MVATARRGFIGVDVGTRAVKLAQVEQAAGGLRLIDAVIVPRAAPTPEQPSVESDTPQCREEVGAAMALARRFVGRSTAGTVSMHWCRAKTIPIPADRLSQPRAVIEGELGCYGRLEESVFDYWKTGIEANAAEPGVENAVALIMARSIAARVADDLTFCGLDCRFLDGLPLALARSVDMMPESGAGQPVAALDWGFREATLCTVAGRTPIFVRRLRNCGFGSVLRRIAEELDLEAEEVEFLLLGDHRDGGPAVGSQLHRAVMELAAQPLRAAADELQRTFAFLANQLPSALPEKIWLFGAGAVWNGAAEFLSSNTGRPAEPWRLRTAGIQNPSELPFPEAILGTAVSLSALAWSKP